VQEEISFSKEHPEFLTSALVGVAGEQ